MSKDVRGDLAESLAVAESGTKGFGYLARHGQQADELLADSIPGHARPLGALPATTVQRRVVGVSLHLNRSDVIGLTNTAERLGELLDSKTCPAAVRNMFGDGQAQDELERFYNISRAAGSTLWEAERHQDEAAGHDGLPWMSDD